MNFASVEQEYLITLLGCAIKQEDVPAPPQGLDWNELILLSKQQQVYSIIASVINLDDLSSEQAKTLKKYTQSELVRTIAMRNEFEIIKNELAKNKIKFMPLKGFVIRKYYPKEQMRQMSDVDILYDYSKRDTLLKIMKSRGFRLTTSCENSDDFFKEPYYTFEWHRELFFNEAQFCPHFDLWLNATQDSDNQYMYRVESTEHFVYTICHMYKHYATNGCGIRFICDIYVLMNYGEDIDTNRAFAEFENNKISDFAQDAIALTNAIFNGGSITKSQQWMLDYLLNSGVYGKSVVDYKQKLSEFGGSKLKYFLSRIFPSVKNMKANYRKLERKPYLLPLYYVIRLCSKLKYNYNSAKNEIKQVMKIKN